MSPLSPTDENPTAPGRVRRRPSLWLATGLVAGLSLSAQPSHAQPIPQTPGVPFSVSWDYPDYNAHSQNWAIAQDPRGVMYFGNSDGVLLYDGGDWRLISVTNDSIVRSLAVDGAGTVYLGAVGELGFLRADDGGNFDFVSLLDQLSAEDRDFTDVWRTWAVDDGVYFWAGGKLFRWRDGRFRTWAIESSRVPSMVRGHLYNNQPGVGLTVLGDDDAFHPVAGGDSLDGDRIMVMLPYGEGEILVGSRDGELRLLSSTENESGGPRVELERFETAADDVLARHQLYAGVPLPTGGYALATISGGSVVIDADGRLQHRFTRVEGLRDESVWSLYVDREQGLWHGLNRGITRFELGTPITTFGETAGLDGTVEALCTVPPKGGNRDNGPEGGKRQESVDSLYVATSLGLYRLAAGRVEKIADRAAPYWSLLATDLEGGAVTLLAGALDGVYELRGGRLARVMANHSAFVLQPSTGRQGRVWVGDMTGAGALQRRAGEWLDAGRLAGVDKEVRSIVEDGDGRLWLGTHFDGVLRVTLAPGPAVEVVTVERFGADRGLPSVRNLRVLAHDGGVLVASAAGLFRFESGTDSFVPASPLGPGFGVDRDSVLRWSPDAQGNIWLSLLGSIQAVAVRQPDGSYELDRQRLSRLDRNSIHAILPEPDAVWLGGVEGLFRVETAGLGLAATSPAAGHGRGPAAGTSSHPREQRFAALIRRVRIAPPAGRTLFGGGRPGSWTSPVLPYAESSLRFEYALPSFDGNQDNRYRSRLVGLEEGWGDWTDETYRDFTALREGGYRFEVQGRDTYNQSSEVAAFDFRLLPPWYRTWWAYALYAAALALVAWTLLSWLLRRARLEMEVVRLAEANALMQRTEEDRQQFVRELEAKNREMERFIYTVAHDLKSPLISIRGFLGMLQRDMTDGKQGRMRHDMERIHAATGKMARLVEELLELSKIGRQIHEPEHVAMGELAREAADQVAGLIAERRAEVAISPEMPPVTGDRRRLQAMLQNLIENGVKYMGEQSSPRIVIDCRPNGGATVYRVRDNGIGIDPRYQEKIFGLFERLSTDTEGTGVGLALVKRIVEVHGGRIWAESEGLGKGSTFCFTLPGPPAS